MPPKFLKSAFCLNPSQIANHHTVEVLLRDGHGWRID